MADWIWLICAGCCEVLWAVSLKLSDSFTKFVPSAVVVVGMLASVGFLTLAVRQIPIGTSYAIWTGIGSTGTSIAGILMFGEPATFGRIFFLTMIIVGIIGLYFVSDAA